VADLFLQHFVASGGYQKRFFTRDWQELPAAISFGHDIEASWLLWEAGAVLDNGALRRRLLGPVAELADSVLESGAGPEGEVFHEGTQREAVDRSRIWWVQAEALVGFMNAWQLTADERFLEASRASWAFIRDYQRDTEYGEWAWHSRLDRAAPTVYKAGFWKAPYHNGRAMLEMIRRLSAGQNA
jgi:mannobiose 2-epimerase